MGLTVGVCLCDSRCVCRSVCQGDCEHMSECVYVCMCGSVSVFFGSVCLTLCLSVMKGVCG